MYETLADDGIFTITFGQKKEVPQNVFFYNGKTLFKRDDLGGKPTIFGNTHISGFPNPKDVSNVIQMVIRKKSPTDIYLYLPYYLPYIYHIKLVFSPDFWKHPTRK